MGMLEICLRICDLIVSIKCYISKDTRVVTLNCIQVRIFNHQLCETLKRLTLLSGASGSSLSSSGAVFSLSHSIIENKLKDRF